MSQAIRRVGIAIGSLVMAYLSVSLAAGVLLGPAVFRSPLYPVAVVVLGGLIFVSIIRGDGARAGRHPR